MELILANQADPRAVWGQLVPRERCFVIGLTFWLRNQEAPCDEIGWLLESILEDLYQRINAFQGLQIAGNSGWQVELCNDEKVDGLKSITFRLRCQRCPRSNQRMASSIHTSVWQELMEVVEVIGSLAKERETNDPDNDSWAEPQPAYEMRPCSESQEDLARKFDRCFVAMRVFHPDPTTEFERSMLRCAVARSNRPPPAKRFTKTRLYHGPVIALDKVGEIIRALAPAIQRLPNLGNERFRRFQQAMPEGDYFRFNDALLQELDRNNSKELIETFFPQTRICMETCVAALEAVAYSRHEPSDMDICAAIHAIRSLRRCAPPFTASVLLLEDAQFQKVALWTTIATGAVIMTGGAAVAFGAGAMAAGGIAGAAGVAGPSTAVVGATTATTATSATTMGLGSTAVLAGGTAITLGTSICTVRSVMAYAQTSKVKVINEEIDMTLRNASYYLALSFLSACGVSNSTTSSFLQELLKQLDADMPPLALRPNVPAFLQNLIEKLWRQFSKVQDKLKKAGYNMQWMQYTPPRLE